MCELVCCACTFSRCSSPALNNTYHSICFQVFACSFPSLGIEQQHLKCLWHGPCSLYASQIDSCKHKQKQSCKDHTIGMTTYRRLINLTRSTINIEGRDKPWKSKQKKESLEGKKERTGMRGETYISNSLSSQVCRILCINWHSLNNCQWKKQNKNRISRTSWTHLPSVNIVTSSWCIAAFGWIHTRKKYWGLSHYNLNTYSLQATISPKHH